MQMLKNRFFLLFILILFSAKYGYADEFHYINNNVGDRASGMAGAYTAVSDDSAGCYYNPAGLAFAPGNKFSASVNAINRSNKNYKGVLTGTGGGKMDWEQESLSLMPNYFGLIQKFGPGMLGFSYAVPDSFERQQKQTFTNISSDAVGNINRFTVNMNDFDKVYLFGPSYAYSIMENLSVGATLYYYYRDTQLITNQFIEAESGDEYILNQYQTKTEHGVQPIIGVLWEPVNKIALGLSLSKRWITSSDTEIQNISNASDVSNIVLETSKSDYKADNPLQASIGAAWFPSPSLMFSTDLKYFEEVEDREWVLNCALGAEYYPNESFAIRGGLYTDMANNYEITSTYESPYSDYFDIYGTSLSFTFFTKRSSITLGFVYSFGSGDSQPIGGTTTVYDVDYNNISVNLSTSFNY